MGSFLSDAFFKSFSSKYCKEFKMYRKGKDTRKKRHQILSFHLCVVTSLSAPSCFCLCSFCFWGEVSNSWILNYIGRNCLLGNGKKIVKFLMRTFTCRSTFLYEEYNWAIGLQISSQWEFQQNRFAFISFGKIQFLPPCIWDLPFM